MNTQMKKLITASITASCILLTTISPIASAETTNQESKSVLDVTNHPIYIKINSVILNLRDLLDITDITMANKKEFLGYIKECNDMVKSLGHGNKKIRHALNKNIKILEDYIVYSAEVDDLLNLAYPSSGGKFDLTYYEKWNDRYRSILGNLNGEHFSDDYREYKNLLNNAYKEINLQWTQHNETVEALNEKLTKLEDNISVIGLQTLKQQASKLPATPLTQNLISKIDNLISRIKIIKTPDELINDGKTSFQTIAIIETSIVLNQEFNPVNGKTYIIKKSGSLALNSSGNIYGTISNNGTLSIVGNNNVLISTIKNYGKANISANITANIINHGNYISSGKYNYHNFHNFGEANLTNPSNLTNENTIKSLINSNILTIASPTIIKSGTMASTPSSEITIDAPTTIEDIGNHYGSIVNNSTFTINDVTYSDGYIDNRGTLNLNKQFLSRGLISNSGTLNISTLVKVTPQGMLINTGTITGEGSVLYSNSL